MKMGFTEKEVGQMTLKKWKQLYDAYKLVFDLEKQLINSNQRYSRLDEQPTIDDVIPF
jgi:hypothetical protein